MPGYYVEKPVRQPRPKSKLSVESDRIIDEVIAYLSIPENAVFYDQSSFGNISALNHCQTEGCLAGWMVFVKTPRKYNKLVKGDHGDVIFDMASASMTLANGSPANTANLFTGSGTGWPKQFSKRWIKTLTMEFAAQRRAQALIAIDRLKFFKRNAR